MQLHDKGVMVLRAANMLTKEEKHRALQYLMYLKKTRCGGVKSREVGAPMGKTAGVQVKGGVKFTHHSN
jgi:hypothetical protein